MKKLLASILSLAFLFGFIPPQAWADEQMEFVATAMKSTLMNDFYQADENFSVYYGNTSLTIQADQFADHSKMKADMDIKVHFDSKDFPNEVTDGISGNEDFMFNGRVSTEEVIDLESQDAWFKFSNLGVDITAQDDDVKKVVEGFLEIFKVFSNTYYHINSKEIQKLVEGMSDAAMEELTFPQLSREDIANIAYALFNSGIFEVKEVQGSIYKLDLTNDLSSVDFVSILQAVSSIESLGLNDVMSDLESEISGDALSNAAFSYSLFRDKIDFQWDLTIDSQEVKESLLNVTIKTSELNPEVKDILIKDTATISTRVVSVNLPNDPDNEVNITKLIEAVSIIGKKEQEKWDSYNSDWEMEMDAMNKERITPSDSLISEISEEKKIYGKYAKSLAEKGILQEYNPQKELTHAELISYLGRALEYLGRTDTSYVWTCNYEGYDSVDMRDVNLVLNAKYGGNGEYLCKDIDASDSSITKLQGTKDIIRTLVPHEKRSIRWAIDNKVLAKTFSIKRSKEKTMKHSDLYRVLFKMLDKIEN
ncbi:hypothetical protein HON22_00835 [Candidatus Peregrinibacteria bacterium]|jgi:hypothetical protein|nr:hypothetical protein [Candidatus Peregrinibacteria bacterium]